MGGLWPLLLAVLALAALTLLASLCDRRGWSQQRGWPALVAMLATLPLLGLVAARAWDLVGGICDAGSPWWLWLTIAVAIAGAALLRSTLVRVVAAGTVVVAIALHAWASAGCADREVSRARDWVEEAATTDDDAERAALALRGSGGGRMSIDQALEQSWPPGTLCDRKIHFSSDLLFGSDETTLSRRAAPQLRKLAALLRRYPGAKLEIEGHADHRGDADHNQALSGRRAEVVRRWLVQRRAIDAASAVSVGRGASEPLVEPASDDAESLRFNRRVEVCLRCAEPGANEVDLTTPAGGP